MSGEINTVLRDLLESGLGAWDAKPFLEKVVGIVPSIIYVFNQKTQANEYTNRSLGESLGYEPEEIQTLGAELMPRICHPDDLPKMGAYFSALQEMADGEVSQLEYRMKHKDGRWVWLLSYDTVFERDEKGDVLRHIGVAADITAQKEAEEKALAERRAADAANEELRSFAYSLSHDMKAPSNTLKLLLSELQETYADQLGSDGTALLDLGLGTLDRMQNLIEEVLGFTRVIGEQVELTRVSLHDIVDQVLLDAQSDIKNSGAQVEVGDLPDVLGNEMQIRILFQNLIDNALKFRKPDTAPVIRIAKATPSNFDNRVSISVADNGIGIPAESQEQIFSMFKRLHLETDYAGAGLGLAICRRIAIAHGGDIAVQSSTGEGAIFTVSLAQP